MEFDGKSTSLRSKLCGQILRVRNSSQPGAAKALPPSYKHARNTQVQQVCEAFIAGSGNGDRRFFPPALRRDVVA